MSEPLTITRVTHNCHLTQTGDATVLTGPWFSGRASDHPGKPAAADDSGCPAPSRPDHHHHDDRCGLAAFAARRDKAIPVIAAPGKHAAYEVTLVISGGGRTIYFGGGTPLIPWLRTLPGHGMVRGA